METQEVAVMSSERYQRLAKEVSYLSPEEQADLRDLLNRALSDEVNRRLLARGTISRIPDPPTSEDVERRREWKPIAIEGKPLSEIIIEERR